MFATVKTMLNDIGSYGSIKPLKKAMKMSY